MNFIIWESEIQYRFLQLTALGLGDMLDEVVKHIFLRIMIEEEEDDSPKIAVVGKPNVGKVFSLSTSLLGENRVIVSDIAGTTRDAIDTKVNWNGQGIHLHRYRRTSPQRARSRKSWSVTALSVL